MKKILLSASVLGAVAVSAVAFAPATSGLKPGERVTPFHPTHFVGPLAKTNNCFPCTFQNRPQVQVWVNGDDTENVAKIAKTLQGAIEKNKSSEFKALVVFVAPKAKHAALGKTLEATAAKVNATSVGMAVIDPSDESVSAYKINLDKSVKNTVFVYKNWKVAQTFVNLKGDKAGLNSLSAAIQSVAQ